MAKILIIEDMVDQRSLMAQLVISLGHDVTICENGEEGIKKVSLEAFDLVITDVLMPERDGLEVLSYIRESLPKDKSKMPVLAVSGGGFSIDRKIALDAAQCKADKVMKKPFKVQEFNDNVSKLLSSVL